jgi:tetratricopeptide (TPR) repeat protein
MKTVSKTGWYGLRIAVAAIGVSFLLQGCAYNAERQKMFTYHFQMGVSKLGEKNPTGALVELTEAERINPDDTELLFYLARAYFEKKKFLLAEDKYLQLLKIQPAHSAARNDLGVTYLEMQRWDDAISQFKLVLDDIFYQGHEEARLNLGLAYYGRGDYAKALSEFRPLLMTIPKDPRPRYNLGRVYMAMGKTDMAVAELARAIEIYPGYALAHYQLGLVYQKDGNALRARESFSEALRLAPDTELGELAREQIHLLK